MTGIYMVTVPQIFLGLKLESKMIDGK